MAMIAWLYDEFTVSHPCENGVQYLNHAITDVKLTGRD